jgi:hypothetical protein
VRSPEQGKGQHMPSFHGLSLLPSIHDDFYDLIVDLGLKTACILAIIEGDFE